MRRIMILNSRSANVLLAAAALVTAACGDNDIDFNDGGVVPTSAFAATFLTSDQPGVAAHTDPAMVNSWGLAMDAQSFWVANNGTGRVVVLAPDGSPSRVSPAPAALQAVPGITGIVFNPTSGFLIGPTTNRAPAQMLVASETGQIFAINPNVASSPQVVVDRSGAQAVYKGLTIITSSAGVTRLAATDFRNARIDIFDTSFQLVTTVVIVGPNLRAGLAPFNIATIGNNVIVTYAVQDATREDDVPGIGNGRVDLFDRDGRFVTTLVDGGLLNAPWGVALAPSNFGPASNQLIIGNFGDGTLLAIDPVTGVTRGHLLGVDGNPLVIDGLWGLAFGNNVVGVSNVLYFAAGPAGETHGLFGRIDVTTVPVP
jgi:uncharacterized protein (TIGR03118 family)